MQHYIALKKFYFALFLCAYDRFLHFTGMEAGYPVWFIWNFDYYPGCYFPQYKKESRLAYRENACKRLHCFCSGKNLSEDGFYDTVQRQNIGTCPLFQFPKLYQGWESTSVYPKLHDSKCNTETETCCGFISRSLICFRYWASSSEWTPDSLRNNNNDDKYWIMLCLLTVLPAQFLLSSPQYNTVKDAALFFN